MEKRPEQPPEGKLLAAAADRLDLSIREAAKRAGISYGRWRQIVMGYQNVSPGQFAKVRAPAKTLAKMAAIVGVTAEQMETEGQRPDAALALRDLRDQPPAPWAASGAGPPSPDEDAGSAIFQPLVRVRLDELTGQGNPRPSGDEMFLAGGDPLGAGDIAAAGLARGWDIAMQAGVHPDVAVGLTAKAWVRLDAYLTRRRSRPSGIGSA